MHYEKPEVVELGKAEELTLLGVVGCQCDCCCGYRACSGDGGDINLQ